MVGTTQTFLQITSLEALHNYLNPPLINTEWGILSLDLDQTLIQARPTFGDEHFYHFLKQQNEGQNIDPNAHYHWTVQIRSKINYDTCESIDKINAILKDFQDDGWSVKVLTSRGLDMREITKQHLEDAGLILNIEDVIFKTFCPGKSDKLLEKDKCLINWMETQPQWETCERIRILFPDDSDKYCKEVARIADQVERATVTCLHCIGFLPNPELSESQMKQLVVQLHAHSLNQHIPYTYSESDVTVAMEALNIQALQVDAIYTCIRKIAGKDNFSF